MEYSGGRSQELEWKGGEDSDTAGMGRSYECVFCKRGFTTAQALGGHMNIHRKDRANTNTRPATSTARAALVNAKNDAVCLKSYLPAGEGYLHGCSFPVDCGRNWSVQVGPARVDDGFGGEELDLELRLGHGRS